MKKEILSKSPHDVLVGKLIEDPIIQQGKVNSMLKARMIVSNPYRDKSGRFVEDFTYINLIAKMIPNEIDDTNLHKGSVIQVEGQLQSQLSYDREGRRVGCLEMRANRIIRIH
jgi:single-stranded DNA-binding protein